MLMPVILATQEAEIRRIVVRSQVGQIVPREPILKNPSQNKAGGVTQSVGPEFKPQYHKKKELSESLYSPKKSVSEWLFIEALLLSLFLYFFPFILFFLLSHL
jgi:hypothetical protein